MYEACDTNSPELEFKMKSILIFVIASVLFQSISASDVLTTFEFICLTISKDVDEKYSNFIMEEFLPKIGEIMVCGVFFSDDESPTALKKYHKCLEDLHLPSNILTKAKSLNTEDFKVDALFEKFIKDVSDDKCNELNTEAIKTPFTQTLTYSNQKNTVRIRPVSWAQKELSSHKSIRKFGRMHGDTAIFIFFLFTVLIILAVIYWKKRNEKKNQNQNEINHYGDNNMVV